jgi:hypothetical protein
MNKYGFAAGQFAAQAIVKPKFATMEDEIEFVLANNHLVVEDLEQHLAGIKRKWKQGEVT